MKAATSSSRWAIFLLIMMALLIVTVTAFFLRQGSMAASKDAWHEVQGSAAVLAEELNGEVLIVNEPCIGDYPELGEVAVTAVKQPAAVAVESLTKRGWSRIKSTDPDSLRLRKISASGRPLYAHVTDETGASISLDVVDFDCALIEF